MTMLYPAIFATVALWAWVSHFINMGSPLEHLLPSVSLAIIGMPATLLMEPLITLFPAMLNKPVLILFSATLLGLFQVAAILFLVVRFQKK